MLPYSVNSSDAMDNLLMKVVNCFCRTWIRGMENAENGLGASNKTGPLSIFA